MKNTPESDSGPRPPRRRTFRGRALLIMFGGAIALVLAELAAQAYYFVVVSRHTTFMKQSTGFYYEPGPLGYALRPGTDVVSDGRTLHINAHAIRGDDAPIPPDATRIALLGDSVAFGTRKSQDQAPGALLQNLLDPAGSDVRVLNFGVPGYALEQMPAQLAGMDAIYHVDAVVFLLNLNDYARRGTVTEGMDDGLYRLYHPPMLKLPWMIRKAIYRMHKGFGLPAGECQVEWFRWAYAQNRAFGEARLDDLARYARERNIPLITFIVPNGRAYHDGDYELREEHTEIAGHLREHGVEVIDPVEEFAADPRGLIDPTEHLTHEGDALAVRLIEQRLRETLPVLRAHPAHGSLP